MPNCCLIQRIGAKMNVFFRHNLSMSISSTWWDGNYEPVLSGCVLHTGSVLFEGTVVTNNASMMLCWNNMFIHNHVAKICPNFLMSLFPIETCAGVGSYEGSCVSVWKDLGKLD